MATFRKRGRYWQAQIMRKGFPPQYRSFDTKADAEAWATVIESEIRRGVWVNRAESESTPLGDALDRYAREITVSKKSALREMSRIRLWKRHSLSIRFLASLRGADFALYRDDRLREGAATNTVRLELALISHLYTVAAKEWGMEGLVNPIRNLRMPQNSRSRDRRLDPNEESRLMLAFDELRNPWMKPLVTVALETAARQSELLKLRWEHVDLKKRVARLLDTKNSEDRVIPLSTCATEVLSALPRSINGQVFATTQSAVIQAFERARIRAQIENLRFHDLRHEATSRFFEKGFDMVTVAAITGHKTLQMLKRYVHLRVEDLALKLG